jgi:hypothetical protein
MVTVIFNLACCSGVFTSYLYHSATLCFFSVDFYVAVRLVLLFAAKCTSGISNIFSAAWLESRCREKAGPGSY